MKFQSNVSLARQLEMVFREVSKELQHLSSGLIFIHIRNNMIGKFGVKHDPMDMTQGRWGEEKGKGLTPEQICSFRQMAIQSLQHKHWTHGEIEFEFALKKNILHTSVTFESNYNMSNLLSK